MTTQLDFIESLIKSGPCDCPTCGRHAQVYKRHLHCAVARQLIKLFQLGDNIYVHASKLIPDGQSGSGDLSKARYWGLIEPMPNDNPKIKANGYWRLTSLGVDFVNGHATVPSYVLVFNDTVIYVSEEHKSITECLSKEFDYQELMGA